MKSVPVGCPETSVRNYYFALGNNPEERASHLLRGESLKSLLSDVSPSLEPCISVRNCAKYSTAKLDMACTARFVDYITFVQQMHIIFVNTQKKQMNNILFLSKYIVPSLEQYNKTNKKKKIHSCCLLVDHFIGPYNEGTTFPQKGVEMWRVIANVLKKRLKRETTIIFSSVRM